MLQPRPPDPPNLDHMTTRPETRSPPVLGRSALGPPSRGIKTVLDAANGSFQVRVQETDPQGPATRSGGGGGKAGFEAGVRSGTGHPGWVVRFCFFCPPSSEKRTTSHGECANPRNIGVTTSRHFHANSRSNCMAHVLSYRRYSRPPDHPKRTEDESFPHLLPVSLPTPM